MTPNKIYLSKLLMAVAEILDKPVSDDDVEYIRKDALMEWAKQKQYESLTIVADNFWQEVIDKINEI